MGHPTKPPLVPLKRSQLWRALRQMRVATTGQLEAVTELPGRTVGHTLRCLARTGYVRCEKERAGKRNSEKVWRLVRDTGPKPPLFLFDKEMGPAEAGLIGAHDRNNRVLFGIEGSRPPADLGRRHNRLPKRMLTPGVEC